MELPDTAVQQKRVVIVGAGFAGLTLAKKLSPKYFQVVLLDKNNPIKTIDRMNTWFIKPDKSYEISGQVNNVCFIEGLAQLHNQYFLYYGTADSKIAVAVKK